MGKVFAFHGGIHPPENKHQSSQSGIATAPLAKVLNVPVQQHIGAPAKICVTIGDKVLKGQRIADAQGKFSVAVHAPSSGTIAAIGEHPVPHPSGMNAQCVSIETDGLDQWVEHTGLADFRAMPKFELIDYIRDRGIAGMGGAGFPTAVKLHLSDDHIVNTLIINAAECEPYITADDLLIRERAADIISGINILQHLIEPSHVIIGIEDNKPQAIRALEEAIANSKYNIHVVSVPTKYPSGGEKQLIKLLTNVEVPSGGIPADVGIVCQNIGTVYALNNAVRTGESLISRIVTVTGEGVSKPQNYETLIGTPFSVLLDAAGHRPNTTSRLIVGGPMMGYSIDDTNIPVVKTSNCIIAASSREMPAPDPAQACIRCGMCEQVCPAQLLPQQLHWYAKSQEYDKAQQHNLFDCIECGACSYVCPSNIPLVQYYRHAKTSIREEQQEKRKSALARERFEAKQMREQRAIDEKAEKRKARADQAAKAQAAKQQTPKTMASNGPDAAKHLKSALLSAKKEVMLAQRQLDRLTAESDKDPAALSLADLKLQQAKSAQHKAQQDLSSLDSAQASAPDTKKLKIAAAQATTMLKKAQQALKAAQEKGQPGIEQLNATVQQLTEEATTATQAFEAAEPSAQAKSLTASVKATPAVQESSIDTKKLKTAAAIARTKLKKAQSQYEQLVTQNSQDSEAGIELKAQLDKLEQRAQATETAFVNAKPATTQSDTEQLQQNYDKAHKLYYKALAALNKAEQDNSPAVEKMRSSIDKLKDKLNNAENALAAGGKILADNHAPLKINTTLASNIDSNQLQLDLDKAAQRYHKAVATFEKAQADQNPAAQRMQAGLDKLKAKLDDAQQALDNTADTASSSAVTPATPANIDSEQLQQDADKARARYHKALAALEKAQADQNPAAQRMQAGVDKLKAKFDSAQQALENTADNASSSTAIPATPAKIDSAQLQQDVDKARARYHKALAALEKAQADQNPAAQRMQAGVDKLKAKLETAQQALDNTADTANSSAVTPAAPAKIDSEQLQQDVDKARARYHKALAALEKAQADQNPAAQRMQAGVDKLKAKLETATTLRNASGPQPITTSTEDQE